MQLDTDSLANEAEEKANLVLLSKSNALRKAGKEKETALEKIDDELRELAKKSSNLCTNLQLSFFLKGKRTDS